MNNLVIYTNNIPQCPYCQKPTKIINLSGGTSTLMYCQPAYDDNGNNTNPDGNRYTQNYTCLKCQQKFSVSTTGSDSVYLDLEPSEIIIDNSFHLYHEGTHSRTKESCILDAYSELCKAQKEYIQLLSSNIDKNAKVLAVHNIIGSTKEEVEKGIELRNRITTLEEKLK